jgi:flagellum-specific peptidoglycan hydrolase FlgJ
MEVKDYERILEININGEREFNENGLVKELIKYKNIKYPHIVLAQAKLESNNYSSRIFMENNNLFGMKEANVRITTAEGTQYKHARYETWQESVLDYILWQNRYGSKCKTEQQYYNLLNGYAEDTNYQAKLKNIISKNNLKELFN